MDKVDDPVRAYLSERGSAAFMIEKGLAGLVEQWEVFVGEVAAGYALGLDDYLNELDVRQLLAAVWPLASATERETFAERLEQADAQMRTLTQPLSVCLWGAEVAEEEGWTPETNWWYFSRPLTGSDEFLAEIAEACGEVET